MKRVRIAVIAGICVLGAALLGWHAEAQQDRRMHPVMWEYRDGANLTIGQLNTLGAEGWELVVVTPYGKDYYYILKRVK